MDDKEVYFELWKIEQAHVRIRWQITTFFLSLSFGIFGFSFYFSADMSYWSCILIRFTAVIIYLFAYFIFLQFNIYTDHLRKTLAEFEQKPTVAFTFQRNVDKKFKGNKTYRSAKMLLAYLGICYLGAAILLAIPIIYDSTK